MLIIQAVTTSGEIIEKARWEVESRDGLHVGLGHAVSISVDTSDKNLLGYVRKQSKNDCSVDESDEGRTAIMVAFVVKKIGHLIDGSKWESMCVVIPEGRLGEQALLYLMAPEKCDRRFMEAVRG